METKILQRLLLSMGAIVPTQVEMRVNGSIIQTLHVGRIEGTEDKHSINTYVAVIRRPGEQPDWYADDAVEFQHQYGNGIVELTRRALNAIKENNELG
jgi:hypothetical protein